MAAHRVDCPVRLFFGNERDQHTFVREIERVEAEDFAKAADVGAHRQRGFLEDDADASSNRHFVEHRGDPAAGRVAHRARSRHSGEQHLDQSVERPAVADHRHFELDLAARGKDCGAVLT